MAERPRRRIGKFSATVSTHIYPTHEIYNNGTTVINLLFMINESFIVTQLAIYIYVTIFLLLLFIFHQKMHITADWSDAILFCIMTMLII